MTDTFDAYHKWLAIPPGERPPNHYRLLGVEPFETDGDVISSAADQRMAHLKSFQSGPHSVLSQKLLNEVSVARLCLLNPTKRDEYDRQLKAKIKAAEPKAAEPTREPVMTRAMPLEAAHEAPLSDFAALADLETNSSSAAPRKKRGNKHSSAAPFLVAACGVIGVVAVATIVYMLGFGNTANTNPPGDSHPKTELPADMPANSSTPRGAGTSARFPLGKWVELLDLASAPGDDKSKKWRYGVDPLSGEQGIPIPVTTSGEYDLRVEFTRLEGDDTVAFYLPVASRQCMVTLSGWHAVASGLMMIDGKEATENETSIRPGALTNNHRYVADIAVRGRGDSASILMHMDGAPFLRWQGKAGSLSLDSAWWKYPGQFGVSSWNPTQFHSMKLRMVSGKANANLQE